MKPAASVYLVNGAPSWLQLDAGTLSWWPAGPQAESAILCEKQRVEFAQIVSIKQRLAKVRLDGEPGDSRADHDNNGGNKSDSNNNNNNNNNNNIIIRETLKQRIKRLAGSQSNLSQLSLSSMSTVNEMPLPGTKRANASSCPGQRPDLELKRRLAAGSASSINLDDLRWNCEAGRPVLVSKLKVYYAKRNESKTTGRLMKLKKLTIQLIKAKRWRPGTGIRFEETDSVASVERSNEASGQPSKPLTTSQSCQLTNCDKSDTTFVSGRKTHEQSAGATNRLSGASSQSGSAPPSCYVSEGSSGRLSSCSSSMDSPAPMQQQQQQGPSDGLAGSQVASVSSWADALDCAHRSKRQPSLIGLHEQLERQLAVQQGRRPKRLLVFVNPFGGKGRALQVYKSRVKRLLELAQIETKLVVTQYANHARDTLEDPQFNVEYFDGIICIGGDGMFSELMNGLLFRHNRDKILASQLGVAAFAGRPLMGAPDGSASALAATAATTTTTTATITITTSNSLHEHPSDLEPTAALERQLAGLRAHLGGLGQRFETPPIPVGVIGAGSTDCNSFGLIGTNDATTATLNIILGKQICVDVCSIHSIRDDRLLRFVSTFIAYGYFGDVIRESEKLRWLGPSRYDVTGLGVLLRNRAYNGLVRIVCAPADGRPQEAGDQCHLNCSLCKRSSNTIEAENNDDNIDRHDDISGLQLIERRGPFVGVNAAVMACRCPQTRKGFSPGNHLANGCADLILVRPCTRMQYVNYLLRTGYSKKSAFDLKFVDAYRCRQFEFIAQDEPICANQAGLGPSSLSSCNSDSLSSQQSSTSNSFEAAPSGQLAANGSSWNADGEILAEQSIRVKVNNRLLRVFGTGEPQPV